MNESTVRIWNIQDRSNRGVPAPYIVRWKVGAREHNRALQYRAAADRLRSSLMVAHRQDEPFDPVTGEPRGWKRSDLTVAQWAHTWVRRNWDDWEPRTRRSNTEALYRALPILVAPNAPQPPADLRASIAYWLTDEHASCPASGMSGPSPWRTRSVHRGCAASSASTRLTPQPTCRWSPSGMGPAVCA
jgi:hypothetical protein